MIRWHHYVLMFTGGHQVDSIYSRTEKQNVKSSQKKKKKGKRKNRSKKPPLGLGAAKEGNSSCHKIPTVFENIKRLYSCFGWFACYCQAFHPSQDIAVFAVFEFDDLQMKPMRSAFHRTVITSKLCILSSLLTILFFCYFSYCSDGFSSI